MKLRAWLWLLACVQCTALAGEETPLSAEDEVRALIGLEHGPWRMEQPINEHLSCLNYGGGGLFLRGREHGEWGWGMALCKGRWVKLLTQFLGGNTKEEHRWRIVDAYLLPEVVGILFDPQKPTGPYLYTWHECSLDGRWDSHFHAVVRLSNRKRMDWRTGVLGAWGYNMKAKRIVPLSAKRVVCHKVEPE